jgi:hypothetical protein
LPIDSKIEGKRPLGLIARISDAADHDPGFAVTRRRKDITHDRKVV